MTLALVVTALVGLAVGVWLGMPGRYTQTPDEIEKIMESGGTRRRKTRRVFTPLAWMQRRASAKSGPSRDRRRARGRRRSGFSLESPDERE
jgi:hypothetical protein